MKLGKLEKLKKLLPRKNVAFSVCSCNRPSHMVHSKSLKRGNKRLVLN